MEPRAAEAKENEIGVPVVVDPLGHALGNADAVAGTDAEAIAAHFHHAASLLDHIGFLDVEGVQFGHHAGGDTRSRQRNVRLGRVVEKLGDVATLRRRELPKASARDEEWMGHDGLVVC